MYRTLIACIIFIICLAIPPAVLAYTGSMWILPQFWGMFILLNALTLILIFSVSLVQKRHPDMYAQTFLAVTVLKMLLVMAFALLLVLKIHVDNTIFIVDFFYIYFLNTAFEVYVLLRNLRNQN